MKKDQKNDLDKYLFHEGTNYRAFDYMGSFLDGDECTFRVWAPGAKRVYVTGEFCNWDPFVYEAEKVTDSGIYECRIKNIKQYDAYKYVFETQDGRILYKSDPYARHFETRPNTSSKVYKFDDYEWGDQAWMKSRKVPKDGPMNIYELHLGTWKTRDNGEFYSYREYAELLLAYLKDMKYTHVELLPLMEHPYDKSWGYQVTGYFAPTSRYGLPEDLMYLVDLLHQNNIGIILDWVPGHFPKDESGLCEFDGSYAYEYSDPLKMEHKEWGTRVFDYGKNEVASFLISNAVYWLDKFHIDGLRVDAVSSMLYLDYFRQGGEWRPNKYGGKENLEVLEFLKKLNEHVHDTFPGAMMIAEESTAWPKVTHPAKDGGLDFDFKWNMGWMNDSLKYLESDPYFRSGIHNCMTFSITYAFSENYILALSHDEVVHGKKSIFEKAYVPYEDKFKSLRVFLAYMFGHPGKKLNFMGTDIAQVIEWNDEKQLDWVLLDYPLHATHQKFVRDLNAIYAKHKQLWELDTNWDGFRWNTVDDNTNNVFSFTRYDAKGNEILVICNFSSQKLKKYKIGVSSDKKYKVLLNSDAKKYGGDGLVNRNIHSIKSEFNGFDYHIEVNIGSFGSLYLVEK